MLSAKAFSWSGEFAAKTNDKPKTASDAHLVQLSVNMNDVWIVASAWEHGLIFLTADKMAVIRDVMPEVTFDNWLI